MLSPFLNLNQGYNLPYFKLFSAIIKKNNLHIYHYLDYDEILPKIDYVIHHGGAGILYSCIKYNKPAVIVPPDYDQFDYVNWFNQENT